MYHTRAAAVALAVGLLACSCSSGGSHRSAPSAPGRKAAGPTSGSTVPLGVAPSGPPAVPTAKVYLGTWVNPAGITTNRSASALEQASTLSQLTGVIPAILGVYTAFASPAPLTVLAKIAERGAIPLVSWGCAPTSAVGSGRYDALISRFATALRDFGHPVFLRWFWEMNLPTAESVRCNGGGGPEAFVTAWRRVRDLFREAGATNVAFVWCPGVTADVARMTSYFPGAAYVDWIGADGYEHRHLGADGFTTVFSGWYDAFRGYAKPMMIAETGAMAVDQAQYLAGLRRVLPAQFPLVAAVVYFDAAGPNGSWVLTGGGLQAFAELGRDPYFSARG